MEKKTILSSGAREVKINEDKKKNNKSLLNPVNERVIDGRLEGNFQGCGLICNFVEYLQPSTNTKKFNIINKSANAKEMQ